MNIRATWIVISAIVALAGPAHAVLVDIPGVFSTGVDNAGVPLANGTADPHYTLTSAPIASPVAKAASNHPAWVANTSTSKWINPTGIGTSTLAPGTYLYDLVFDLTGYIPSTATISGKWASDNGSSLILNGTTFFTLPGAPSTSSFNTLHAFNLTTGFVSGLNTLRFAVQNDGTSNNPTGLHVQVSSAKVSPVPEPGSLTLLGLGLAGLGALRRRRSQV